MKRLIGFGTAAALSVVVAGATFDSRARETDGYSGLEESADRHAACTNRTIKGTYGIHMHGTRPVPGGTVPETVIGVVIRTYDGRGGFTQVDNVKGTVTGIAPNRPGSGTYVVNADCSATTLFQPAPGVSIEERLVIVDYGYELHSITVSPAPLMVESTGKRIGWR